MNTGLFSNVPEVKVEYTEDNISITNYKEVIHTIENTTYLQEKLTYANIFMAGFRTISESAPSGIPRDGEEWIVI